MKKLQTSVSSWTEACTLRRLRTVRKPVPAAETRAMTGKILACCAACLLAAGAASASPDMGVAAETSSTNSVALNLQNYGGRLADASAALDLSVFFSAWSEAAVLNTYPFVGLLITIF